MKQGQNAFKIYLVNQGYIKPQDVLLAQEMGEVMGRPFIQSLMDFGGISQQDLAQAIQEFCKISSYDPIKNPPAFDVIQKFPKALAYEGPGFPAYVDLESSQIVFALADPFDERFKNMIRQLFNGKSFIFQYAPPNILLEILESVYDPSPDFEKILGGFEKFLLGSKSNSCDNSPPTEFVTAILKQAIISKASDIHLEPEEHVLRVRFRIDGVLHLLMTLPKKYYAPILIRFKVLGRMNMAENRLPQSSHLREAILGKSVDFRLSTHPTLHGENLVIRVLDSSGAWLELNHLGFLEDTVQHIKNIIHQQEGLIVVTGPTGSGKTTTLYAILRSLMTFQKNIMTLEQPIEYYLPFIRQTEIPEGHETLDFASGIRSILRQDPDVILVGEIRDPETAAMAFRAAMTGHLVLTTLHTYDALGVIGRLKDLGVKSNHISDHLKGVIAQRLVRLACSQCKTLGCDKCQDRGFRGRQAIEEVMLISSLLQEHIRKESAIAVIREAAISEGFQPIKIQGLRLVDQGKTTLEEISKTLGSDLV